MGVDDIRFEILDGFVELTGHRHRQGEVAAVEVLYRRHPDHIRLVLGLALQARRHDQDTVARHAQLTLETLHRLADPADDRW